MMAFVTGIILQLLGGAMFGLGLLGGSAVDEATRSVSEQIHKADRLMMLAISGDLGSAAHHPLTLVIFQVISAGVLALLFLLCWAASAATSISMNAALNVAAVLLVVPLVRWLRPFEATSLLAIAMMPPWSTVLGFVLASALATAVEASPWERAVGISHNFSWRARSVYSLPPRIGGILAGP